MSDLTREQIEALREDAAERVLWADINNATIGT